MKLFTYFMLATFFFTGCSSDSATPKKAKTPPIPILVAMPTLKDIPLYIETIGTLHPWESVEIKPQVTGTLEKIHIKEGKWVKQGEILFTIDSTLYTNRVQQAQAQLAIDRAAFTAAQKKVERLQSLAERDLLSKVEWDNIEAEFARSEALLKLGEAKVAAATLDCKNCQIRSPIDGKMGKIHFSAGSLISGGQSMPLATISQIDPLRVSFKLTEKEFPKLPKKKGSISITSLCNNNIEAEGNIYFVDNAFDPQSGLISIHAKVANDCDSLRPGQCVGVLLPTSTLPNSLLIPQKAVQYDGEGPYAYVVDDKSCAIQKRIRLGDEIGEDVIVQEGIEKTETVVTTGHLRLSPGLEVEIAP